MHKNTETLIPKAPLRKKLKFLFRLLLWYMYGGPEAEFRRVRKINADKG